MRAIGKDGEDYTAKLLRESGYQILTQNYSSRYGEIDIIATTQQYICFVEVKTRRVNSKISGEEAVTPAKQRRIIKTALLYLQENPTDMQIRFDVCCVHTDRQGKILKHNYLTGAFDGEAYEKRI